MMVMNTRAVADDVAGSFDEPSSFLHCRASGGVADNHSYCEISGNFLALVHHGRSDI